MKTVTFKSVLHGAARLAGVTDTDNELHATRAADVTAYLNERFREGWEHEWWPEWTVTERRRIAPDYAAGTTYAAPSITAGAAFVYHHPSRKFYQALKSTSGNAPADLTGGVYVVDASAWREAANTFTGNDWLDATDYVAGDVVRNPADDEYHACHTAHTSSGSLDASKFGLLVPFRRVIAWNQSDNVYQGAGVAETPIGHVRWISESDPRVTPGRPLFIDWRPIDEGLLLPSDSPGQVWLTFRRSAPEFTSSVYSSSTTYAVGDVVYHPTTGECYTAIAAGSGNAPTDTAYWTRIEFPRVLSGFVKLATAGDILLEQKQRTKADALHQRAQNELALAAGRELEMQRQYNTADAAGFA